MLIVLVGEITTQRGASYHGKLTNCRRSRRHCRRRGCRCCGGCGCGGASGCCHRRCRRWCDGWCGDWGSGGRRRGGRHRRAGVDNLIRFICNKAIGDAQREVGILTRLIGDHQRIFRQADGIE